LRCGAELVQPATGRRKHYCGDACRKAGQRLRQRRERLKQVRELTPALRLELKRKVNLARRAEIERQRTRDRALFADEVAA
jgi:hypothetical protein